MSLKLYYHPLSSFCMKALVALYETGTPFEKQIVDLGDEKQFADFRAMWPIGKFPVLRDEAKAVLVPEATIIVEYLAEHHPGGTRLIPADPEAAREMRLRDRIHDLYVNTLMQKIVTDKLRPEGQNDSFGVEEARTRLRAALGIIDADMATKTWAVGNTFTMADCAACPALFYADKVIPLGEKYPSAAAYLGRLEARPSFARVLEEAQPYFALFPG
jgi:glutathione S-transferase